MPQNFFRFLSMALISICSFTLQAQLASPITFQHIRQGLSQSSATVLFEDSDGFIWIGTRNGLNKYDGTDFEIFEKSLDGRTGLTHEYIGALYEDNKNLYIGTNQGLSLYDRTLDRVRPFEFKNEGKKIESKSIKSIAKTKSTLWLGTYADGLYGYHIETGALKHFLVQHEIREGNHNHNHILKVAPLENGRLLVISSSNVLVIDEDLQILKQIPEPENITSVTQWDRNKFLVGTANGSVVELEVNPNSHIQTKKMNISPGFAVLSLAIQNKETIWIGTENNGLFVYSKATGDIEHMVYSMTRPHSIASNSIWSLLSARNGVIWMAPFKNGLSFYDPEFYKFEHIAPDPFDSRSLNHNLVNCFSEDGEGNIWIGTDGGGLNYWNRSTNTFEHYSLKDNNFGTDVVLSLLQTQDDRLWAGSWTNGITIFNIKSKQFEQWNTENSFLRSNHITDLHQDKRGRIWIINLFGGVQVYYPESGKHTDITLVSEPDGSEITSVYSILEEDNGQIWIGSQTSGVFRLIEKHDTWTSVHYHNLDDEKTLSNDFVNSMVQDTEGRVWIGTQGGLNRYLPERDTFLAQTKLDGLKDDAIKGIIADNENNLWLSTEDGITKYSVNTGKTMDYDMGDGLQSNEFNAGSFLTTGKGELIFGGTNGFNIFTPEKVGKRDDRPMVFISGMKIFNRSVTPNDGSGILNKDIGQVDSIHLSYNNSVVDFAFKALTYRHPEKVNYAYFLEGFETEWNNVGNAHHATYTNLDPGNYTLRIKSTNSDGVWADNERRLHITVDPPFWKTWWFRISVIFFVLVCLYILYAIKVRNIKKYQAQLERRIEERTQQLQQQKDKLMAVADELSAKNEEIQRFTFAVSHDLKSPLSNIKGIASLIPLELVMKDFPNLQEYLGLIDVSCDTMSELISDITQIARLGKIENRNEVLDTNEIMKLAKTLISGKLCMEKVQLEIADNLPAIYGDRNRMIQVFGNFLDNAIKYMGNQSNPLISIGFEKDGPINRFWVKDNGSGLDERALKKLFTPFERFHSNVKGTGLGLYMIKQIVLSHGGTISVESEGKGKGTVFILSLPNAEVAAQKAENRFSCDII